MVWVVRSRTSRFTRQCVLPPDCTHILNWLCSRHKLTLLQPRSTGSHLYPPNLHTLGSKVEIFVSLEGLTCSRGRPLRFAFLNFLYLLYHTWRNLSRGFSNFFEKFPTRQLRISKPFRLDSQVFPIALLTLLLYYKVNDLSIGKL